MVKYILILLFTVGAYANVYEDGIVAYYKMDDAAESNTVIDSNGGFHGGFHGGGVAGIAGAKAIARWDVVAHQTIDTDINIGVVAFHANANGIDNVTFTINGGNDIVVESMAVNSRTDANEFFTMIDVSEYADGLLTITAVANPNVGVARTLNTLYLWNSDANTFDPNFIYVATTGNDTTGDGSSGNPYATIMKAIVHASISDGGIIELKDEGSFDFGERFGATLGPDRYITIQAASGLTRENVIINRSSRGVCRPKVTKIHFKDLTIDFGTIILLYPDWKSGGAHWWCENCYWTDSVGGWEYGHADKPRYNVQVEAGLNHYATDSDACDILIAFSGVDLARNCTATRISGDVYAAVKGLINCTAADVNGLAHPYHSDFLQYTHVNENRVIYGLDCSAPSNFVQCMFLDDFVLTTHTDFAFIDIDFSGINEPEEDLKTQFWSSSNHLYFRNVNWTGQKIIFRTDGLGSKKFVAQNVVFEDCTLYSTDYTKYITNGLVPDGVTFKGTQQ